jgi:putative Mn2+ efflux pump MntP
MDFLFALAVALSLSMDAFAVAISCGISVHDFRFIHSLKIGLYFGVFQFGMPVLGYLLGSGIRSLIEKYDHWIAFIMLAFLGGKMLYEAFAGKDEEEENCCAKARLTAGRLTVLAVATSIDALIIGITIALTGREILFTSAIIGITCFVLSAAGGMLGKLCGKAFSRHASVVGGIILIVIGIQMLFEHLSV